MVPHRVELLPLLSSGCPTPKPALPEPAKPSKEFQDEQSSQNSFSVINFVLLCLTVLVHKNDESMVKNEFTVKKKLKTVMLMKEPMVHHAPKQNTQADLSHLGQVHDTFGFRKERS